MAPQRTPMRWPEGWSDVSLLRDCPVNYVLADSADMARRLTSEAAAKGLSITFASEPPPDVEVVKGAWPGTKLGPGGNDRAAAGPTGDPWIDSNGWKVLLALAQHPEREIWVDTAPIESRLYPENWVAGLADAAAHGGRWIIKLDKRLAAGVAAGDAASKATWKRLVAGAGFFANWRWPDLQPLAWIGVISDFSGENEFLSQEVLNLLARANQPYRVIPLERASVDALAGLKAVLYVCQKPPSQALSDALNGFAEQGGLLIAGKGWLGRSSTVATAPGGAPASEENHPRYQVRRVGKGRVAVAIESEDEPYLLVRDAVVLLSHRHDLIRFWNGGAVRACLSASPDRRRTLLQLVFYATARAEDSTVRVAGKYRKARLFTPDAPTAADVPLIAEKDAVELHLPSIEHYGAVQLDL